MFLDYFQKFVEIILYPFGQNYKLKLVFVMIIFPFFQNCLLFWITDSIIKGNEVNVEIVEKREKLEENQYMNSIIHDLEENFEKAENNIKSFYINDI